MSTLLLVRHAQSTANAGGILAGRLPGYPLSTEGQEQAQRLANTLAEVPIRAVYTSPVERCVQTATTLANPHNVTPIQDAGLAECDYGDWSGQKLADLSAKPEWSVIQATPSQAVFPGGESVLDMSHRAVSTVHRLRKQAEETHGSDAVWVVCSHGDIIKGIVAHCLGLHLDLFQRLLISTASVSVVTWQGQQPCVSLFNDTGANYQMAKAYGASGPTVGGETR